MKQKWKRPLALLLSVAMMFSISGTPVYAADMETGASAVCPHHVHDETCGYSEGTPSTHEHTDDCYSLVTQCVHEHTAECYSDGMLPAEGEEKAADACTHVCSEESGCITKELNCPHVHDETCGYSEGSPCTFDPSDCELCNPTDSGEPEAPAECACETLCTADSVNPDCPVCGAEGADLAACAGTVEEGDAAEETDPAQTPAEQTILSWEWIGADNLNEGVLPLPGVSAENPVDLDAVVSMLPTGITATVDGSADPVELALTWSCGDFPETASAGEYTFTAALPEGYTLGEETAAPTVAVVLGGAQTLAITPVRPTGDGTEQNPYQIGTAAELLWFGQKVADDYYSYSAWATLTADINMEGETWPTLVEYSGTFDGAGHTISNLTIPEGFVSRLTGGTIKNLTLDATCMVTGSGSFCDSLSENGTIQNCTNKADVTNSRGAAWAGGICSQIYTTGTIENCINLGNVTGLRIAGGICGQQMAGTIQNCSNIGTVATTSESGGEAGGICGRLNDGSIFNCHWLSGSCGSAIGYTAPVITITTDGLYSWSEEAFASGKVCFLLNKSSSGEGTVWRQNLDNGQTKDPYPVLDSTHGIVYINGANYTNTKPKHTFDEDGFCTEPGCSYYQPAVEVNGVYQIYNNGQLLWFAAFVNNDAAHAQYETSDPSANAMLMNDLALNHTIDDAATWVPIGNRDISYCGTFDGNGKTISNLVTNGEKYQGFVGHLGDGGVIQNLTLDATCSVKGSTSYGNNYLGGICGRQSGGTIQNCANYAEVSGRNYVGGICGSQEGNSTIKFCYNASVDIYGNGVTGGICGFQDDNSTIEFCYNSGKVDGYGTNVGAISGWFAAGCTIRNCYWLQGSCSTGYVDEGGTAANVEQKTAEEFASGAVCFLLNNSTSEDVAWHQNLDNGQTVDAFPVLDSSHGTVYHGPWHCGSVTKEYTNNPDFQSKDEHSFDESAICTNCGAYQPAEAQNGVYQIKNVGNLFWFAALVNGDTNQEGITQAVPTANAVLTADIDLGGREWTPIAPSATFRSNATSVADTTDKSYSGTFDGQGHTISNFEIRTNSAELTSGLFGAVTGTIQNLGIVNASFDNGGDYDGRFGALCGLLVKDSSTQTAATIQNCYVVNSSIEATGKIAGAVCGANYGGTIQDCYECGNTVTAHERIGHLVGDNQNDASTGTMSGTVTNCYSDTQLAGTQGGTVNGGGVKDAEEFASGEVAWLLNGSTSEGSLAWYQTLGESGDPCPVLDSTHSIVYCGEDCLGNKTYDNSPLSSGHNYDENGFCTLGDHYQPADWNEAENRYEISNDGQLFWFAALVNGDTTQEGITQAVSTANAVLTADIDLSGQNWTPIGNGSTAYTGTFDGQGHTISGMTIENAASYSGLFGNSEGTIKSFTLTGSITVTGDETVAKVGGAVGSLGTASAGGTVSGVISGVHITVSAGNDHIGGVVGSMPENSSPTVENCIYTGKITVTVAAGSVAGIVGYIRTGTIQNCANQGSISVDVGGTGSVGGILGYCNNGGIYIRNCYNTGAISADGTDNVGAIVGQNKGTQATVSNCYYLTGSANQGQGQLTTDAAGTVVKTADEFASGEVTYLLNGSTSEDLTWYQNLDNDQTVDSYPVLDSSHGIVYRIEADPVFYSNDPNSQPPVIISVDITWGDLSFTYSDGTWNPDTHTYDGAGWNVDEEGGNSIKVENTGNTDVNVTYDYKAVENGIIGSFTDGETPVSEPVSLPENGSSTVYLILAGKPEKELEKATIGSVTVTIGGESE